MYRLMLQMNGSIERYYNLARYVWGTLVVIAILSRAIIPAGMMPDFQSQGMFQLTICSGDGMKTIEVPAGDYGSTGHSEQKQHNEPCPYAAGLNAANLALAVLALISLEVARVLFIGPPAPHLTSKPLFTNTYPRAPPRFS